MKKAKFIGKYYGASPFERDVIELEYEYRGMRYSVYENRKKGNEPLAWQHRSEQDRIDRLLDTPDMECKPFDLDEIWKMLGWD